MEDEEIIALLFNRDERGLFELNKKYGGRLGLFLFIRYTPSPIPSLAPCAAGTKHSSLSPADSQKIRQVLLSFLRTSSALQTHSVLSAWSGAGWR